MLVLIFLAFVSCQDYLLDQFYLTSDETCEDKLLAGYALPIDTCIKFAPHSDVEYFKILENGTTYTLQGYNSSSCSYETTDPDMQWIADDTCASQFSLSELILGSEPLGFLLGLGYLGRDIGRRVTKVTSLPSVGPVWGSYADVYLFDATGCTGTPTGRIYIPSTVPYVACPGVFFGFNSTSLNVMSCNGGVPRMGRFEAGIEMCDNAQSEYDVGDVCITFAPNAPPRAYPDSLSFKFAASCSIQWEELPQALSFSSLMDCDIASAFGGGGAGEGDQNETQQYEEPPPMENGTTFAEGGDSAFGGMGLGDCPIGDVFGGGGDEGGDNYTEMCGDQPCDCGGQPCRRGSYKTLSTIRTFRDNVMMRSALGRKMIGYYYAFGRNTIQYVQKYALLRWFIRGFAHVAAFCMSWFL